MFYFLLTGEIWMEEIALEALGAGAVIFAAIISAVVSTRKLNQTVAVHDTKADKNKELLEKGQHALSQEHTGLKEQVAQVGNATKEQVAQVGNTVTFLKEEKLKETARQEALQGKELKVDEIATILHAVSREVQELRQQVQQLTTERDALHQQVQQLTAERDALHQQVRQLTAERDAPATDKAEPAAKLSRQQECHAEEDEDELEP
ncbi:MAG: hypothetical protein RSC08_06245 [Oscillospiraceae bacterium]